MGIYRDNLSAVVIGDNLTPIIAITQNSFDLSITYIAFVIQYILLLPINYRDKRFFMPPVFKTLKLESWRYGKSTRCPLVLLPGPAPRGARGVLPPIDMLGSHNQQVYSFEDSGFCA